MLSKIRNWIEGKAVEIIGESDWFRRNGYYRLAALKDGDRDGYFTVSEQQALQVSTWHGCLKVLSEDTGIQPFHFYQADPSSGGKIRKATEDPIYPLLHDLPNPETNAGTFVETVTAHAAATGTGYANIVRNRGGTIVGLYPIMPEDIRRQVNSRGVAFYEVRNRDKWDPVSRKEIFDLPGFSWTGTEGNNVARLAQRTLGLSVAQESYAGDYFIRDKTPGIVLEHPGQLSDEGVEKIKLGWRKSVRSHDVAVAREGMKVHAFGKTNVESQLLEQRMFQVLEVCRWFRMPSFKLGDLERMTFSNVEHVRIDYTTNVLMPWNRRWKQSVYRCLLTPEQRREGFYAELSVESHLRGDFKAQTDGFRALLEKGVYNINEVRAWYNLNPIPGGDAHFIQLNMQTVVDAATNSAMEAEGAGVRVREETIQ